MRKGKISTAILTLALLALTLAAAKYIKGSHSAESYTLDSIPPYSGNASVVLNNNIPSFTDDEKTTQSFEKYSELDYLGRCGAATACLSRDTHRLEKREI